MAVVGQQSQNVDQIAFKHGEMGNKSTIEMAVTVTITI